KVHAGQDGNVVEVKRQRRCRPGNLRATGDEGIQRPGFEVTRSQGRDGGSPKRLGLGSQGKPVGEAVGADVNDETEGRASDNLAPAAGKGEPLLDGQGMTLPGAAAEEDRVYPGAEQVFGLFLDNRQVQLAVRPERRVGRGDESVQFY